jgi:hypothetical protein
MENRSMVAGSPDMFELGYYEQDRLPIDFIQKVNALPLPTEQMEQLRQLHDPRMPQDNTSRAVGLLCEIICSGNMPFDVAAALMESTRDVLNLAFSRCGYGVLLG